MYVRRRLIMPCKCESADYVEAKVFHYAPLGVSEKGAQKRGGGRPPGGRDKGGGGVVRVGFLNTPGSPDLLKWTFSRRAPLIQHYKDRPKANMCNYIIIVLFHTHSNI